MKKLITVFAFVCLALGLPLHLHAQNLTTVSGSNITDINGAKLAAGQLCFLITDQQDNPISVSIGGGGQALKRGYCSAIAAGVVASFTVPNPASTQPSGIYYRVTVKDSSTGLEVLRYTTVSFTGATFWQFSHRQSQRDRQRGCHGHGDSYKYSRSHSRSRRLYQSVCYGLEYSFSAHLQ
jgi:hypothetical protein